MLKYYAGNQPGVLLQVHYDDVDLYDENRIIESLKCGDFLITLPEDQITKDDNWGWYGHKYEYIRVLSASGKAGSVLRSNVSKVED